MSTASSDPSDGWPSLLSRDDWIYTLLLTSSFLIAAAQRFALHGSALYASLRLLGGPLGFFIALLVLKWKIFYSLPVVVFTIAVIHCGPLTRKMPLIVFSSVFSYLIFVRHLHQLVNLPELASQANALQLILTLRAIGLAYEVSDGRYHRENPGKLKPRRYLAEDPGILSSLNYFYHFCGLFTGPYYSFQCLEDSYDVHAEPFHTRYATGKGLFREYRSRLMQLAVSTPVFIFTNSLFPLDGLRSDAIWEWSILYRLFYAAMVFVVFRMRVYAAWAISECVCVTLHIGIYPAASKPRSVVGPTDLAEFDKCWKSAEAESDSSAVVNIDIHEVEASDGFRSGVRAWNKSVQSWLALYVHSRAPPAFRMTLTMFVSALWHGTYAGYFMSFMVVPMCTAMEDILFRLLPRDEHGKRSWLVQQIYIWTIRCRGFDFLATGFLLKNFADTHRFWSSLYYWLPLSMLAITAVLTIAERLCLRRPPKPSQKSD